MCFLNAFTQYALRAQLHLPQKA
uniref:Uncharacterized protein n=1 Tax=Rhizophora mucronata TaxID=61149 RepID=A0A2P2Q652_RHIMU